MMNILDRECALVEGPVPPTLRAPLRETPAYAIARDAFLLKLPNGLAFHYERGKGVTVFRPDGVTDAEVALFFSGSVYGAIAWINGFVPLHASAVVHDGRVHAFTGASGAGKSTLAAALGSRDFQHFCDDVLVLDLRDSGGIRCLPGHNWIKLWSDALTLTGLAHGERVRRDLDKYFVKPPSPATDATLPIGKLYFLKEQARTEPTLAAVKGSERFALGRSAFYRPHFCAAITDGMDLFTLLSRIAEDIEMASFDRPKRREAFAHGADFIANAIRGG